MCPLFRFLFTRIAFLHDDVHDEAEDSNNNTQRRQQNPFSSQTIVQRKPGILHVFCLRQLHHNHRHHRHFHHPYHVNYNFDIHRCYNHNRVGLISAEAVTVMGVWRGK